jgi:hypothetical protein
MEELCGQHRPLFEGIGGSCDKNIHAKHEVHRTRNWEPNCDSRQTDRHVWDTEIWLPFQF